MEIQVGQKYQVGRHFRTVGGGPRTLEPGDVLYITDVRWGNGKTVLARFHGEGPSLTVRVSDLHKNSALVGTDESVGSMRGLAVDDHRPNQDPGNPGLELTLRVTLTPEQVAQAFIGLTDEEQADVFIHAARLAKAWGKDRSYVQWLTVGRHLRTCGCSTPDAREMIEGLHDGLMMKDSE